MALISIHFFLLYNGFYTWSIKNAIKNFHFFNPSPISAWNESRLWKQSRKLSMITQMRSKRSVRKSSCINLQMSFSLLEGHVRLKWRALSACRIINLCPCCSRWSLRCQKIIIISSPFAWFVNWRKWCRRRQTTWFDHTRLSSFCHQSLSCWHHHCLPNHSMMSSFCYQSFSRWHHHWSFCQHIVLHVVVPIACYLKSRWFQEILTHIKDICTNKKEYVASNQ